MLILVQSPLSRNAGELDPPEDIGPEPKRTRLNFDVDTGSTIGYTSVTRTINVETGGIYQQGGATSSGEQGRAQPVPAAVINNSDPNIMSDSRESPTTSNKCPATAGS